MEQITLWSIQEPQYTELFRGQEVPKTYAEIVRKAEAMKRQERLYEVLSHLSKNLHIPLIEIKDKNDISKIRKNV